MRIFGRRKFIRFVLVVWLTGLSSGGLADSLGAEEGRDSGRIGETRWWMRIDFEKYFQLEDPMSASRKLLADASSLGIPLNVPGPDRSAVPVAIPNVAKLTVGRRAEFMDTVVQNAVETDSVVCLVKMKRYWSVREVADLLGAGVRVYRDIQRSAFIASVPTQQLGMLTTQDYVEWFQPYDADLKLQPGYRFGEGRILVEVVCLGWIHSSFRNDLQALGAEIIGDSDQGQPRFPGSFDVMIDGSRAPRILDFDWVFEAYPLSITGDVLPTVAPNDTQGGTNAFGANDSRRLICADKLGSAAIDGVQIGIVDGKFYTAHEDLSSRIISSYHGLQSELSSGGKLAMHGTHVTGIVVGKAADVSHPFGGLYETMSGAAKNATALVWGRALHGNLANFAMTDAGMRVVNNSWREGDSLTVHFDYRGVSEALDIASDVHGVSSKGLLVCAAGNYSSVASYSNGIPAPANAKDVLVVGAVNSAPHPNSTIYKQDVYRLGHLTSYSATGPTRDKRLAPHLVAPGGASTYEGVVSCAVPSGNIPSFADYWGTKLGSGAVYAKMAGTSMAAPHVTAAAAVVAGWYHRRYGVEASAELLKAMVVNPAIPLKWNSLYAAEAADADTLLRAYADTSYGYGLVNVYSGVASPPDEYDRILAFEGDVTTNQPASKMFWVLDQNGRAPRYLAVTMAYNDRPGKQRNTSWLVDSLSLKLSGPNGDFEYKLPPGCGTGSTIQKILVEDPGTIGSWTATVSYGSKDPDNADSQHFGLCADAIYSVPALQVSVQMPFAVEPNKRFTAHVVVTNVGGSVAAGVTVRLKVPETSGFTRDYSDAFSYRTINETYYLDNLVKHGSSAYMDFALQAPPTGGSTVDIVAEVDAINKVIDTSLPVRESHSITVNNTQKIKGSVQMLGWGGENGVNNVELRSGGSVVGRTRADGTYTAVVPNGFTGVLTPVKGGEEFDPPSIPYTNPIVQTTPDQNYKGTYHHLRGVLRDVSGNPVQGIEVRPFGIEGDSLIARSGTTNSQGEFDAFVEHGWSGTLVPQPSSGYTQYVPDESTPLVVPAVLGDRDAQDFVAFPAAAWGVNALLDESDIGAASDVDVASDGQNGAIAVWNSESGDIFAQRVDVNGQPVWGQKVIVCGAGGVQYGPAIVPYGDGSYLVTWLDMREGVRTVFGQRMGNDGSLAWTGDGVELAVDVDDKAVRPSLDVNGKAWFAWARTGDVYAQAVSVDGESAFVGAGVLVCDKSGEQSDVSYDVDGDGYLIVGFEDVGETYNDGYVQRVHSDGSLAWGTSIAPSVRLRPEWQGIAYSWAIVHLQVVGLVDGGCLVQYMQDGGVTPAVTVARFDPSGTRLWKWGEATGVGLTYQTSGRWIVRDTSGGAYCHWVGKNYGANPLLPALARTDLSGIRGPQLKLDSIGCTNCGADASYELVDDGQGGVLAQGRNDCIHVDATGSIVVKASPPGWSYGRSAVTTDGLGGMIAAWVSSGQVVASRLIGPYQPVEIDGLVLSDSGLPVPDLTIDIVGNGLVRRTVTRSNGEYSYTMPLFWNGVVTPRPRGYLNTAVPASHSVTTLVGDVVLPFTLIHEPTTWVEQGLRLSAVEAASSSSDITAARDGGGGCYVAWRSDGGGTGKAEVLIQRITRSGDQQWTRGGEPFLDEGSDEHPIMTSSSGGNGLLTWQHVTEDGYGNTTYEIRATKIAPDMQELWLGGRVVASGADLELVSACRDGAGGVFITWHDGANQELLLQHLDVDGSPTWGTPIVLVLGGVPGDMYMERDGAGGVVLCWQQGIDWVWIYAQHVTATGYQSWNNHSWPETVRANAPVLPGGLRSVADGTSGMMAAWSEVDAPGSAESRVKVQKISSQGQRVFPDAGERLDMEETGQLVRDLSVDEESGFFVLYWVGSELFAQNILIHEQPASIEGLWPGRGREIANGGYFGSAHMMDDGTGGGSLVVWTQGGIHAQRLHRSGTLLYPPGGYEVTPSVGSEPVAVASDDANGAYVLWQNDDVFAARVSDSLLVNASVDVSTWVREADGTLVPISDTHSVTCPLGDADEVVVRLEISGEVTSTIPASAIKLSTAPGLVYVASQADSSPRIYGDHYQTTITLASMGGCAVDSAQVEIFGSPVGTAYFNNRSPDIEIDLTPGKVSLNDMAKFSEHCCSTALSYYSCVDFTAPEGSVSTADFGFFGAHYGHMSGQGQSGVVADASPSSGSVVLGFDEVVVEGDQRILNVSVALENVARYQVALLSLRNVNPVLAFEDWVPNPSFPHKILCTEVVHDGQRQIMIGVFGGKLVGAGAGALGHIELRILGDEELELTSQDLQLMIGDLLSLNGQPMSVAQRPQDPLRNLKFALMQNYPNPFNPTTTIQYSLANDAPVDLRIYDVRGALVKTLVDGPRKRNIYRITWDGQNNRGNPVASGVYFYRLKAGEFVSTRKMVLLR